MKKKESFPHRPVVSALQVGVWGKRAVAVALCWLFLLTAINPARVRTQNRKAMEFELQDQFGVKLAYRFPKQRVSVLTFGDRKGAEQIEGWVRPVYERYNKRIDLHGVAVLTSIPRLFHGYARGQFKKRTKFPILLDFKGDVARGYGYEGDKANLVVVRRDGAITLRLIGPATGDGLSRVYAEIDRLMAQAP